jgi:hypothetical protein
METRDSCGADGSLRVAVRLFSSDPVRLRLSVDSSGSGAVSEQVLERLERIESLLTSLVRERTIKEWYTVAEVADTLGKAEFTVREWCRLGRVYASKRACGRGNSQEWIIAHEELTRIRNEGLLPV